MKISIDELTKKQMAQIRKYLTTSPNKPHEERDGEFYGEYVSVSAEVKGDPISQDYEFHNVTFKFEVEDRNKSEHSLKRLRESNEVISGLVGLLVDMTQE